MRAMRLEVAGGTVLIDRSDLALVSTKTIYVGSNGYAYYSTWENGRSYPRTLHSLLVGTHPRLHVDHINGNKLDNRRANLRVVTPSENQRNRKMLNRNNTSGIRGVAKTSHSRRNPWRAQIMVDGRNIYLGLFPTEEAATAARREAEMEHWGQPCP